MSDNSNSNKTVGIVIGVVVVLTVLVGGWYFFMYRPAQEAKEQARLEQIAKAKAEKKRKEQEARNKIKYDQLIVDADTAFNQEDWQIAQSLYSEAASLFPNETYPQNQLLFVNAKLNELAELEAKRSAGGTVETVSSATGRFYVLVSSSLDDDLAMDYANKLANEGNYVKVIEHTKDKHSYFGVSLADYDTREEAENATASYSGYGEGVWVLKY